MSVRCLMKRAITSLELWSACLFALVPFAVLGSSAERVPFVLSNMSDMGDPEKHDARNNPCEHAPPHHVFVMHGYEVDLVSPRGGPVEFSMDPLGISSYTIEYENFLGKANGTLKASEVDPRRYEAVFVGGGYGTLFDVASSPELMNIIGSVHDGGGVVGGCGHGPRAFANAKLGNGTYLVKGKRVAGFPNSTERSKPRAKEGTLLPFLVEDQLRKNGAIVQNKDTLADKHDVVVDRRIVSTMFLPSAANVAEEMVRVLQRGKP